ncbi:MAG: hypothetical protein JNL98_07180, partial [Bryobacterales bacterium]|nr:hypothetical protein [Bryobacterales bacterium]
SFKARLLIAGEPVPLASEIVIGDSAAQDGVQNGFLFKLDRQPDDPPVMINLGAIISFIEQQLGAGTGSLAQNPNLNTVQQQFPGMINSANPFTSANTTVINIQSFEINSTTSEFLFSISVDMQGSNPTDGLISLPGELANWLQVQSIAISFKATKTSTATNMQ